MPLSLPLIHEYLGFILIILGLYSILHKDEVHFIKLNTFIALIWCFNFLLIEAITASAISFLVFIRTWASLRYPNNYFCSMGFIAIFIIAGFITYQTTKDIFPVMASILGTIAYFHLRGIKMRLTFIIGCLFWIIHNIIAGSVSSSINEILGATFHIIAIWRMMRERNSIKAWNTNEGNTLNAKNPM